MLPKHVSIKDVGVREGAQFEKTPIPTHEKVTLVDMLSECGFKEIEVTSFVSPKALPQMADAEDLVSKIRLRPGTTYTAICLNRHGLLRANESKRVSIDGLIQLYASDTFARMNVNRSMAQIFEEIPNQVALLKSFGIEKSVAAVSASFGCNFEGDVAATCVVKIIDRAISIVADAGGGTREIVLGDSTGWATPYSVKTLVGIIQDRWPDIPIRLHFHDTHGLGIANALAGLEMNITRYDAAVAGLGGCPFSGTKGAAGNIVSEDLVHLCNEIGVDTGIDFEKLLETAHQAARVFRQALPSRNMHAGSLQSYRANARRSAGAVGVA